MTPLHALEQSLDVLQGVIDSGPIDAADLTGTTPCREFDVGQLVEHILETHAFLTTAAGGEAVLAGRADASISARHAGAATAAVRQWSERGTDGTIDLGGNELPAAFGLSLHALEAYVHAWDLARALDRPFDPPAELTAAVAVTAHQIIDDDVRGEPFGAPYGTAVVLNDASDVDTVDRLIAHTGRNPQMAPTA